MRIHAYKAQQVSLRAISGDNLQLNNKASNKNNNCSDAGINRKKQ